MIPEKHIWLFWGEMRPAGIFTSREIAEAWIKKHGLTGTLSALPVDEGVFEWAVRCDALCLKPEKFEATSKDPFFVGNCLPASLDHFHYENGECGC